ncbi:MAG: 50S ribosomal protein L14e [Nanoarchaeota archaeon]|nr:50S ribosomal protein L14e [Nanoarchaeota archaeon]
MFEVGRLCVKIAGRDAGKKCVVVDVLENNYVLIDGLTRRRKCNLTHLEPLKETIDIKKKASQEDIIKAFKKLGIEIIAKKPKKATTKPKKAKVVKKSVEEKAERKAKKVKAEKKAIKAEPKKTEVETKEATPVKNE